MSPKGPANLVQAMVARSTNSVAGELGEDELPAWRGFLRAHAHLTRELDANLRETHSLSLSAYDVLVQLAAAPDRKMRMSDLAESIVLTPSGLTRLVDRLCREGLVEREECSDDARGSFAVLTELGARRFAEARPTHLSGVRRLFLSQFSPQELRNLGEAWERVAANGDRPS
jgi:DNA-binding MarR family transcriptional regulator